MRQLWRIILRVTRARSFTFRGVALVALLALRTTAGAAEPPAAEAGAATGGADVFQHRKPPLRLAVPEGWRATSQTGFPAILLRLTRPAGGAVITLAVGSLELAAGASSAAALQRFVEQNNAALAAIGVRVTAATPGQLMGFRGWIVDGAPEGAALALRQVYLPHAGHALIWTMTCPRAELASAKLELERIFENLTLR